MSLIVPARPCQKKCFLPNEPSGTAYHNLAVWVAVYHRKSPFRVTLLSIIILGCDWSARQGADRHSFVDNLVL
jgi:hypothetical protein